MIEIDQTKNWGIVAYTDGGARPNPGATGSGIHAYLYEIGAKPEKIKTIRFTVDDVSRYAVPTVNGYKYTDKDGKFSSARDKDAVPVKPEYYIEITKSSSSQLSNNYAELEAFHQVLLNVRAYQFKRLHVCADSMYVINGITEWCKGWERNGFMNRFGEPISNQDLWKAVWSTFKALRADGYQISISHVKGHAGHPGNNQADWLATIGVLKSRDLLDEAPIRVYTPKEYWEPKRDRHPLLCLKRLYFDRLGENYVPGKYFMADPGKDEALIGKPMPETVYAIVRMNEPHHIVEAVMRKQFQVGQDFNEVMRIKMDNLFIPDVFRLVKEYGQYSMLQAQASTNNIYCVNDVPMTQELRPVGIMMRAIDSLNSLDAIFDKYIDYKKDPEIFEATNNQILQVHDLTSEFYDDVEKKVGKEVRHSRVLKKAFGVGHKDHPIEFTLRDKDGKSIQRKLTLKLALDLPERNMLKQLETEDVTVELITWRESELSVRYATVISCSAGMAIWSNFYADRLILKE